MIDAAFTLIHSGIPREAPGSERSSRRALRFLGSLPDGARVLDMGCGPGKQTLVLADVLQGSHITAVDINQPYLDQLQRAVDEQGLADRIKVTNASMDRLDMEPGSVDLIWAEGSAYSIGVENALRVWRPLLKPQGFLGFTDLTWLVDQRPDAAVEFWASGYAAMTDRVGNFAQLAATGYEVIDSFVLPSSDWWDDYYTPLLERVDSLEMQATQDRDLAAAIESTRLEIEIYRRYGESFGYVFYLAQRG